VIKHKDSLEELVPMIIEQYGILAKNVPELQAEYQEFLPISDLFFRTSLSSRKIQPTTQT
jgi:hypothetical protein